MGLRILSGNLVNEGPGRKGAVIYESVSMLAYPYIFDSEESAKRFLDRHWRFAYWPENIQMKAYEFWQSRRETFQYSGPER